MSFIPKKFLGQKMYCIFFFGRGEGGGGVGGVGDGYHIYGCTGEANEK